MNIKPKHPTGLTGRIGETSMTENEYRKKVNPCWGCGCYDEDMGCTMSSLDRCYACPLENENEKRQIYVSVYRDLQQILTYLRKCKTPRTYDICVGRYIRKSREMYAEKKISKSMLHFIESKISMQNAESGIWASEYERATGCHKSRRYNKSRVDAE